MIEFIQMGGLPMYALLLVALVALTLAVRAATGLAEAHAPDHDLEIRIDGVLFWGGYAVVLGFLGTVVGVFQASTYLQDATGASTALIWSALQVSMTTTIVGLFVFLVALLAWHALRTIYRRRVMSVT
jgi:biopolymer transport protein ExbB/TolQ